jgi:hypothetical protein
LSDRQRPPSQSTSFARASARQPCHLLRSFCLLYAAFRLNALLWNGGQHECRILVPNLDKSHCLWHLDCRGHDRRRLAFGLGAHGTAYRHRGFDQPLSSNSRSQNRVAVPEGRFDGVVSLSLQFLALVGARPGEVRLAKWQEFDFVQGRWTIPGERMKMRKEHIVPCRVRR